MPAIDWNTLERPATVMRPYGPVGTRNYATTFVSARTQYSSIPVALREKSGAPGVLVTLPENEAMEPGRGYARVTALGQLAPRRGPMTRASLAGMGAGEGPISSEGQRTFKGALWDFLDNSMAWADRNQFIAAIMVIGGTIVAIRAFSVMGKFAGAVSEK